MFSFLKKTPAASDMILICGLGNPGSEYEKNRHNVGFMVVDAIADEYGIGPFKSKYQGEFAEGRIGSHKVALLKPQTYMNNSGQSVAAAAKFYKIPPENIIVFFDELDLEPGKTRAKKGGGNAGHNGLKSLDAHMGTPDYWRVRIGIGHPGDKARVTGHVLGNFAKADEEWLERLLAALSKHLPLMLDFDDGQYMSKVAMDAPAPDAKKRANEE
ncbi:MAG: aminoacyl-tRNA hydrolase [Alphaproteobacteria bacterium]|nr:aminoacyl-tRNA hydrolase [Alphaproteobacteria bacterium]MCD8570774.1 aminoacyl-tRNA hydrolase [Alphaproteobacteria bacterium]